MVLMWRSEDNGGSQVSSSIMCVPKTKLEVVRFDSRWVSLPADMYTF